MSEYKEIFKAKVIEAAAHVAKKKFDDTFDTSKPLTSFKSAPHAGLFNEISPELGITQTDEVARIHDLEYNRLKKAGHNPYLYYSEADHNFINEASNDLPGLIGKAFFKAKSLVAPKLEEMPSTRTRDNLSPQYPTPDSSQQRRAGRIERRTNQRLERTNLNRIFDIEEEPPQAYQAPQAIMSTPMETDGAIKSSLTNTGGNMNTNSTRTPDQLEVLPKGPNNGPHTATKQFNNCFRVLLDNNNIGNGPQEVLWPIGDSNPNNLFNDGMAPTVKATKFGTPWRQIPNNNIKNYITPSQWSAEMRKGAVGYRVKSCRIKLHGLYNMQRYKYSSDTLQGQDTAYLAMCEPQNSLFLNSRPSNYAKDIVYNEPKTFTIGDEFEFYSWLNVSPAVLNNKLPQYNIVIPVDIGQSLDDNRDSWYPDLTTHESQTLVRNGQTYDWTWSNDDPRYIATYPPFLNIAQEKATDDAGYGVMPMQLLNDGLQTHFEFYVGTGTNNSVNPFSGIGLDQSGGKHAKEMQPLLCKIPQLLQEGNNVEPIQHSAWMYLDYGIEIEFIYGQNVYTRQMQHTRRDGRLAYQQDNYATAIQHMGNPKQYNYWAQCGRTKQANQFNYPWYFQAEPRVPGGMVNKRSCLDNTIEINPDKAIPAIASENKESKAKKAKTT